MRFKEVKLLNKQNFIKLCLILFPNYRSAKFRNNGDIVFWKKNTVLFDNKVIIPFDEMVYKYIPLQLSMYKWRSWSKYSEYFKQINDIFSLYGNIDDKLDIFINDWFKNEIHNTIVVNTNKPFIDKILIEIKPNGNITKTIKSKIKKKKGKLSIKTDYLDPCIQRIKNIDLNDKIGNIKTTLVAATIAVFMRINLGLAPLSSNESTFKIEYKKDVFTEQPFVTSLNLDNTYLISLDLNNNKKFKFFDTS